MDAIRKIEPVERCFDGFLCRAWGESDKPCAEVVRDLAGVRHFLIREWLGGEDDTDADGELTLPRVMAELESQNWEADEQWSAEFEIGGVSVEPVYSFSALASKEAELVRLRTALQDIAENTDPDNGENYRADDREGCLDAMFATATAALTQPTQPTE